MALLALGMCYVLLLANGNADFGVPAPKPAQAPWPQPRQSVPGWLSLHMSYVDRLADSGASQVEARHPRCKALCRQRQMHVKYHYHCREMPQICDDNLQWLG